MSVSAHQVVKAASNDINGFDALVTAAIADNWQPLGSAFINGTFICMSMIKGAVDSNTGLTPDIVPADAVADSAAANIAAMVVDFNGLLASLRASGALLT